MTDVEAQQAHWAATFAAHPEMYGAEPSERPGGAHPRRLFALARGDEGEERRARCTNRQAEKSRSDERPRRKADEPPDRSHAFRRNEARDALLSCPALHRNFPAWQPMKRRLATPLVEMLSHRVELFLLDVEGRTATVTIAEPKDG